MASLKQLLADAKAKELDLKNKKAALKTASRFTGSRYDKFRDNPENKAQVADLRARQAEAQKAVTEAQAAFDTAKKLADDEEEKRRKNPSPEEKQRLADEAARRGEVVEEQSGSQATNVDIGAFTKQIETAGRFIASAKLGDAGRKQLAEQLNAAYGLKLPLTGKYSPELKNAYIKAISDNLVRSTDFNENIPLEDFLVIAATEGTYKRGGTGGGGEVPVTEYPTILSPTDVTKAINNAFEAELNRPAKPEEMKILKPLLAAAQKANPARSETRIVNGKRVVTQTTGLDVATFLASEIKKIPSVKAEIGQRLEGRKSLTLQKLTETANANGLDVAVFGDDFNTWADRVDNGENIDIFKNLIRKTAKIGLPDKVGVLLDEGIDLNAVYSPYKNLMARVLEINADSIKLDDPTLRSAIGPEKEMPIYEFERALRKDPRWQYTDTARQEVSDVALEVLRDFGFQG
jgi:hypothetical protein